MTAEQPLYNSRILNSYLNLIKRKYPHADVRELLLYAEIKPYQVTDEGHWFTQRQVDRFHEKSTQLAGMDLAREAGRFAASGHSIGLMGKYVLGMIGPANAFFAIQKSSANFTRSSSYGSRRIADNKVEITVTFAEGVEEKPYQCANRVGFFEAILMMFNYEAPVIEHPECIFEGGSCCRYVITWKKTTYARVRAIRNRLIPSLFVLSLISAHFNSSIRLSDILTALAFLFLTCSYVSERLERREMSAALTNQRESTDSMLEQIGVNYNNAVMVNEVGQAISKQSDIDEVLENVIKALEKRLGYDRCVILLADAKKSKLIFRTGFGYTEGQLKALKSASFNLSAPDSKGVFVLSFREQRSIFVQDFAQVSRDHSAQSVALSEKMEAHSFICCAIVCEGESLGVLAVDNMKSMKPLLQSDLSLLNGIAPVIGMSLRNAMYIERERRMAEQIRQSQKMEAVGQLAGGIAHDFNNLLTAIIGFVTLAQMKLAKEEGVQKFLEQAVGAAERASNLTQGLLAFSRKQINNPQPADLNSIVSNIKKLLCRLISAEVELRITLSEERLGVVADSGQIEQVLMNLVTNARDAMSDAGLLTISTGSFEMCEHFVKAHGYGAVGTYALLSVSDTGMGMDDATLAHIFEPFFTTKEVGKGTGLGLAIVYGIVKQHDGYLEIHSKPGAGTTFNVYLPLKDRKSEPCAKAEALEACYDGTETVLVAEDAVEVRKLTINVLEQSGYRVIEATDGEDAVRKYSDHKDAVDLIIMDVIMPKMNGKDAYSEITKINPCMKVLFTSGYTPDDVLKKGLTFSKENFLSKPSTPQALLKKVREVLAA